MNENATSLEDALQLVDTYVPAAEQGLPYPVFLAVSQWTPLINVDLLIESPTGEKLLTWREDNFYGPGWHIPGGIIRYKEKAFQRIAEVARLELGTTVEPQPQPERVSEMLCERRVRGHFISMLYRCRLTGTLDLSRSADTHPLANGSWKWFSTCPDDLIPQHRIFQDLFLS